MLVLMSSVEVGGIVVHVGDSERAVRARGLYVVHTHSVTKELCVLCWYCDLIIRTLHCPLKYEDSSQLV